MVFSIFDCGCISYRLNETTKIELVSNFTIDYFSTFGWKVMSFTKLKSKFLSVQKESDSKAILDY